MVVGGEPVSGIDPHRRLAERGVDIAALATPRHQPTEERLRFVRVGAPVVDRGRRGPSLIRDGDECRHVLRRFDADRR